MPWVGLGLVYIQRGLLHNCYAEVGAYEAVKLMQVGDLEIGVRAHVLEHFQTTVHKRAAVVAALDDVTEVRAEDVLHVIDPGDAQRLQTRSLIIWGTCNITFEKTSGKTRVHRPAAAPPTGQS